MIVGFTGTRRGMTERQLKALESHLGPITVTEAHHGDCLGADKQFHDMIRRLKPNARVIIHPPSNPSHRAFCEGDVLCEERGYLERNHDIVDACD